MATFQEAASPLAVLGGNSALRECQPSSVSSHLAVHPQPRMRGPRQVLPACPRSDSTEQLLGLSSATATRQEVVQLANDFRSRQLPVLARQALQSWLRAREDRLREDGSLGLLQLAEDYLLLLQDEMKAVALLLEAYKLDPSFEDVTRRLESLGYKMVRGAWTKEKAVKPASDPSTTDANATGGISVGMTESALRKLLPARPESIARVITSTSVIEVWSYGPIGTSPLTIRLERAGRSEARVVEIGNGQ